MLTLLFNRLSCPIFPVKAAVVSCRLEPIMLLKLPIMLLSSALKSSLLCSEIQIMLIGTVKFNTIKLYST